MSVLLDDLGRPGWILDDLGRPEGEWEREEMRLRYGSEIDFEPRDCNAETMHKKWLYRDQSGDDLGDKMAAFYAMLGGDRSV